MKAAVGSSPVVYEERKRHWRETAGQRSHHATIVTAASGDGRGASELMVDFALGLTTRLPSELKRIEEVRFGVPRPVKLPPKEVFITAKLRPSRVTVEILPLQQAAPAAEVFLGVPSLVRMSARFYHPRSVFPFIENKYLRYRIATEYFDFTFSGEGKPQINFRFLPPDAPRQRVRLGALAEAADALLLLDSCTRSSSDLAMQVFFENTNVPNTRVELRGHPPAPGQVSAESLELAGAASNAWALARAAGVPADVEVSTEGLLAFSSGLRSARLLLEASAGVIQGLAFQVDVAVLPPKSKPIGMRWITICRLGDSDWVVIVAVVAYGPWAAEPAQEPGRWTLSTPRTTCERIALRSARLKDMDPQEWAREAKTAALVRLEERGAEAIIDSAVEPFSEES